MQKVTVTMELPKETYEAGDAIASFVGSVVEHAVQKKPVPQNVIESFSENMAKLGAGFLGADQIPAEAKEDPGLEVLVSGVIAGKIAKAVVDAKKAVVPSPAA